jgi:hypothetical protein
MASIGLALFLASCGAKKTNETKANNGETASLKSDQEKNISEEQDCIVLKNLVPDELQAAEGDQMARVLSIREAGTCLELDIQYSGCEKGRYGVGLRKEVRSKKGLLLEIDIVVREAGFCEMLIDDQIKIDIAQAKNQTNEIELRFNGLDSSYFYRPF